MSTGTVAVIGAGAWGTALGKLLADNGNDVRLWARPAEVVVSVNEVHENTRYLPGAQLPASMTASQDAGEVLHEADLVLLAVPSHATRQVLADLDGLLPKDVPYVSATKGIENESLMFISDIVADVLGPERARNYTCLSGPSFAKEVAERHPSAVVIAGGDEKVVHHVQRRFASEVFRTYASADLVGVEIGGALKNVIAIAAGVGDGMGFGHNTRAAIITRGLAEVARIAATLGANPITVAGLAGMGDLVLTCTGDLSRNRRVGIELGRGSTLDQALASLGHVAEGVKTSRSAHQLGKKLGISLPIVEEVYRVLYEDKPASQAMRDLMTRELGREFDF
jgi:glycerol-3-phosphate dehydrogenase (NAD(P)+)